MERLQELIQRTETIQKVNALQQNVAKQLFTYPILGKKKRPSGVSENICFFSRYRPWIGFTGPMRCLPEDCRKFAEVPQTM